MSAADVPVTFTPPGRFTLAAPWRISPSLRPEWVGERVRVEVGDLAIRGDRACGEVTIRVDGVVVDTAPCTVPIRGDLDIARTVAEMADVAVSAIACGCVDGVDSLVGECEWPLPLDPWRDAGGEL